MRALVIEHAPDIPGGLVDEWLSGRGALADVYRIATELRDPASELRDPASELGDPASELGDPASEFRDPASEFRDPATEFRDPASELRDPDPTAYDVIVTLGSEAAAYDDTVPWIGREQRLLHDAAEAGVPVLGICFGSQLLARALGGRALRAERPEIGWMAINSRDPSLVSGGPWLQWHHDTFTVPAGATLLADSPAGPQAFAIGRSLGVQFHPEVTPRIVADWVAGSRDELDRESVDADRLLADARELDRDNRARALALFDAFFDRVARIDAAA